MSLVTADGGLTGLGYAVSIIAIIVFLLVAAFIRGKASEGKKKEGLKTTTKQLVFCAAAMALAFVTSYLKIFSLPFGGSVTLFSMLFICLIGYWYGPGVGILTGLAYGILQFIQEPYVLSFFQVCCDYILAFAALGLAGVFRNSKHGLLKGYLPSTLWAASYTGWTICLTISPSLWQRFIPSSITIPISWQRAC